MNSVTQIKQNHMVHKRNDSKISELTNTMLPQATAQISLNPHSRNVSQFLQAKYMTRENSNKQLNTNTPTVNQGRIMAAHAMTNGFTWNSPFLGNQQHSVIDMNVP